jgi:hypothetical protein
MATLIAYLPSHKSHGEPEGPAHRRDAIMAWARRRRHRIAAVIAEDELPGSETKQGLPAAVAALGDDGIGGLVLPSLSGLSDDLVVQEQLLAEIRRTGAKVYSLDPNDTEHLRSVSSDPSRNLVRRVLQKPA